MRRALDELGQMSEEQQDLRDETYQSGQAERHRQHEERGQLGARMSQRWAISLARTVAIPGLTATGRTADTAPTARAALRPGPAKRTIRALPDASKRSVNGWKICKSAWMKPARIPICRMRKTRCAKLRTRSVKRRAAPARQSMRKAAPWMLYARARKSSPMPCRDKVRAMAQARKMETPRVKARKASLARAMRPTRWDGRPEASGLSTRVRVTIRWGFPRPSGRGACSKNSAAGSATQRGRARKWIIWSGSYAVIDARRARLSKSLFVARDRI